MRDAGGCLLPEQYVLRFPDGQARVLRRSAFTVINRDLFLEDYLRVGPYENWLRANLPALILDPDVCDRALPPLAMAEFVPMRQTCNAPSGTHPRRRWPSPLWAGGLVLAGAGLFTLYLRQSRLAPFNSDGASNVLQAQAMLHGNLLLQGWWISDVSFYTTELPEYMFVVAFRGLRPDVVHICGALTYTLLVLLAALLARGRTRGPAGVVRGLLAAGIMLAPGIVGGTEAFLNYPDHVGTAVPIFVLLLLLDHAPERWYVPAAACAVLAWTDVADQLTVVAAIVPLATVATVRMIMLRARRRPLPEFRYDALLLAAAAGSAGAARLAEALLRSAGGFSQSPLVYGLLSPFSQIPANARRVGQAIMLLFGTNTPAGSHYPEIIAWYHLIGLALAALGFAVAIITFLSSRADRSTQIIAVATVATLASGIFGTVLPSPANAHDVALLLPFGAVLAGRMLPLAGFPRWRSGRLIVPALVSWLAAGLAALCFAATWTPNVPAMQALANWLADHHYAEGLAGYWQADATTVTSGGKVLIAPISDQATAVWRWESSASWYEPSRQRANFVVAVTDPGAGQGGLSTATVRESFGRPVRQYQVGQYVIMVYDYNLLSRLTPT